MTSELPHLTHEDLKGALDRLYGPTTTRKSTLIAFYGTGEPATVSTDQSLRFRVLPVRCELELREHLPPLDDTESHVAFLVPWSSDIPIDLAGRFVQNGRVHRIGVDARVRRMFGVRELEDAVLRSPLVGLLLDQKPPPTFSITGGRLTLNELWGAWLEQTWGLSAGGELAVDALMAWAAMNASFAKAPVVFGGDGGPAVRSALLEHLERQLGPVGPIIWSGWENGRGRLLLEFALIFEALVDRPDAAAWIWLKQKLKHSLGVPVPDANVDGVVRGLAGSATRSLRLVERVSPGEARAILRAADAHVDEPEIRAWIAAHPLLPSAWTARLDQLGRTLEACASDATPETFAAAALALRALDGHLFFKDSDQTAVVKRAEMAVRLAAWLTQKSGLELEHPPTPQAPAEALGRWYSEEGGYVDWARRWARGSAESALGRGAQAVVEAADLARTGLDRRFAQSLRSWHDANRPATEVLPIDQALSRVAARFLEDDASRRLLVLLLDGMAWAQAVELMQALGNRAAAWGPLAWHASTKGRIGSGAYPVVFAALPTITEVSRAAFFEGKPMKPGDAGNTSKDPERFQAHRDILRFCEKNETPRLLLRSEGHTTGGSASSEALSLIADTSKRVVAMVINAIDAALKGDSQHRPDWKPENIASLPDLLEAARTAGRCVLLASDHGHVPSDRFKTVSALAGGGARWRPWASPTDPVADGEVAFEGSGVWTPRGAHGVVLLADDASRYGGGAHAGEHGGATLAEVVAPCVLIGCDDAGVSVADPALEPRPAFVPAWWHFDVAVPGPRQPEKPKPKQATLPFVAPPPPSKRRPSVPPIEESAFATSDVLKKICPRADRRAKVVLAVDFLLSRNGASGEQAFAAAMGELEWRVAGLVSSLQEVLNLEGYQVLRHSPVDRQVYLDREKLAQQFEVKL